jgi:hypothetical protein
MDENERAPRALMDAGNYEILYFDFFLLSFFCHLVIITIIIISLKLQDDLSGM